VIAADQSPSVDGFRAIRQATCSVSRQALTAVPRVSRAERPKA
jgi:hypothetical protein